MVDKEAMKKNYYGNIFSTWYTLLNEWGGGSKAKGIIYEERVNYSKELPLCIFKKGD